MMEEFNKCRCCEREFLLEDLITVWHYTPKNLVYEKNSLYCEDCIDEVTPIDKIYTILYNAKINDTEKWKLSKFDFKEICLALDEIYERL